MEPLYQIKRRVYVPKDTAEHFNVPRSQLRDCYPPMPYGEALWMMTEANRIASGMGSNTDIWLEREE